MKRFLFLDSISKKGETRMRVFHNDTPVFSIDISANTWEQSERFWQEISSLSTSNQECVHSVEVIVVVVGPGSFTSVRMGVVIANTFAYAKQIPVIGILKQEVEELFENREKLHQRIARAQVGDFVLPEYESDPNISKGKSPWVR